MFLSLLKQNTHVHSLRKLTSSFNDRELSDSVPDEQRECVRHNGFRLRMENVTSNEMRERHCRKCYLRKVTSLQAPECAFTPVKICIPWKD